MMCHPRSRRSRRSPARTALCIPTSPDFHGHSGPNLFPSEVAVCLQPPSARNRNRLRVSSCASGLCPRLRACSSSLRPSASTGRCSRSISRSARSRKSMTSGRRRTRWRSIELRFAAGRAMAKRRVSGWRASIEQYSRSRRSSSHCSVASWPAFFLPIVSCIAGDHGCRKGVPACQRA